MGKAQRRAPRAAAGGCWLHLGPPQLQGQRQLVPRHAGAPACISVCQHRGPCLPVSGLVPAGSKSWDAMACCHVSLLLYPTSACPPTQPTRSAYRLPHPCNPLPSPPRARTHIHTTFSLACLPSQLPDGRKVKSVHVAARIKLPPPCKGLQASLYMQPVDSKYGAWPASGEVRRRSAVWQACSSVLVWEALACSGQGAGTEAAKRACRRVGTVLPCLHRDGIHGELVFRPAQGDRP